MEVTFFRSSLLSQYDLCEFSAWLTYSLGMPNPAGKAAQKGTITHKALELLAGRKLAEQEGRPEAADPELGKSWPRDWLTPELALAQAWAHYTHPDRAVAAYSRRDLEDCRAYVETALTFAGGRFSPLARTVLWPEKYFQFHLEQDWALYEGGRLGLRGTMDLTCLVDGRPDTVELVDWKTGARKDWATGKVKEHADFCADQQLRFYHYALARLLPHVKTFFVTIFFLKDGGPYTLAFGPRDLEKTERALRTRFEDMTKNVSPRRIMGDPKHGWKCLKFCHHGKNNFPGSDLSVCNFMHKELVTLGMERAARKHARDDRFAYTGGGQSGRPTTTA